MIDEERPVKVFDVAVYKGFRVQYLALFFTGVFSLVHHMQMFQIDRLCFRGDVVGDWEDGLRFLSLGKLGILGVAPIPLF